jgi:hypothetical protein
MVSATAGQHAPLIRSCARLFAFGDWLGMISVHWQHDSVVSAGDASGKSGGVPMAPPAPSSGLVEHESAPKRNRASSIIRMAFSFIVYLVVIG